MIDAEIIVDEGLDTEKKMAPGDLVEFLSHGAQIQTVTTSLKVSRSIPRDKFEKNEYFFSNTTNVSGAYALAGQCTGDTDIVKKALSEVIVSRVRNGFDLARYSIRQQQEADGILLVSCAEKTKV